MKKWKILENLTLFMRILKMFLFISFLSLSISVQAQFFVDMKMGIENPYRIEVDYNITPTSNSIGEYQDFRPFRTKIFTIGLRYDKTITIISKNLSINTGVGMGIMQQFVADTINSPRKSGLIYNVRYRSFFAVPKAGVRFRIYKSIAINLGAEGFYPFYNVVLSEQETILFTSEMGKRFYRSTVYGNLGIDFKIHSIIVGLQVQQGLLDESIHWVRVPIFNYSISHELQRLMLTMQVPLFKEKEVKGRRRLKRRR
jgi:hypothetical protein